MNINKKEILDPINAINMKTITSRIVNPKLKININQINKMKTNHSPNPKIDLILKILNLSKNKTLNNKKCKSNSRTNNTNNCFSNRSCSKNSKNTDKTFNYNFSLLKQILNKSIKNNSMNKKIINNNRPKNNIKVIKNSHNKSYNKIVNKPLNNNKNNGSYNKKNGLDKKPQKISIIN